MRHFRGAVDAKLGKDDSRDDGVDFVRGDVVLRAGAGNCCQVGEGPVNVSVGLMEGRNGVEVELLGAFSDASGKPFGPGKYRFTSETTLTPSDLASPAFAVPEMTIGIGFHWERQER